MHISAVLLFLVLAIVPLYFKRSFLAEANDFPSLLVANATVGM